MKALVTNRGNFFVKKENLFGFFNEEGKFLREATSQEFSWAEGKMPEHSGPEVNFDFSSLEEKLILIKKEAMIKLTSFTGMSEEKVQKFLDYFNGSPEELKISGQMENDWSTSACSTGGCAYSDSNWNTVWAILPDGEVEHISSITMELNSGQNANGSWSDATGYTAEYLVQSCPNVKIFLVNSGYHYFGDDRNERGDCWEIFKAPNMTPVLETRKEKAVSMVKDFLMSFKNNLNYQKIYESIKQISISDFDLLNILFLEIGPGWVTEGVSTRGCAYHDYCEIKAWAFEKNGQIFEVSNKIITKNADQNANGSWSDSYGYTFKYLMKQRPEVVFFVINEVHDRQADRQPSVYESKWSFLRPLTRKEIMINKINSQRKVVTLGNCIPELQALKMKMEIK